MSPDNDDSSKLDALGIAVCLYVFGHLRAASNDPLAEVCARQFHLLMNYVLERPEAADILGAINDGAVSFIILAILAGAGWGKVRARVAQKCTARHPLNPQKIF